MAQGHQVLSRREKILHVQVDLITRDPRGHFIVVEVKSSRWEAKRERFVSPRQRQRLQRVASALAEGHYWRGVSELRQVELWLILVGDKKSSVQVFFDL